MLIRFAFNRLGRVSKWLKDADCKSARFVRSSVRIRPLPPAFASPFQTASIDFPDASSTFRTVMKKSRKWLAIVLGGVILFLYQLCSGRFNVPQ